MRIAQVAPLFVSVPPEGYGGTERIVSYLTEELVRQGHEVTLFACGGSTTAAKLVSTHPMPLWKNPKKQDPILWHIMHLDKVLQMQNHFDVIHFHLDVLQLPFSKLIRRPSLTTFHNTIKHIEGAQELFDHYPDHNFVAISESHKKNLPHAHWAGVVYHGINAASYQLHETPEDYFTFVGRVNMTKRPDLAIEIAAAVNTPIKIAARIEDEDMWARMQPLPPHATFVGEIGDADKNEFIGNSKALLFPIQWSEPFGMVMIEAMACGVPVIAFNHGSVPEIIEDGVTGFIVNNVAEAIEAAKKIHTLDRKRIREEFEKRFTVEAMAKNYVRLYEGLIAGQL